MNGLGVIFDMDGVLVDSYRAHLESWQRLARDLGTEMSEEQFAATFGRTSQDIIHELWADHIGDADLAELDDRKEAIYREILQAGFPEMDGARDLLGSLREAGFALAIGSSGPPENVELLLRRMPGAECISATVDRRQVTRGKPDPEIFLAAAEKLSLRPADCAVVEDAPAGIEAARRAGMVAIALTGTADREALAEGAHLIVDSLRDLSPQAIADLIRTGG